MPDESSWPLRAAFFAVGLTFGVPFVLASIALDTRRAMTERITTDWDELPSLRVERAA